MSPSRHRTRLSDNPRTAANQTRTSGQATPLLPRLAGYRRSRQPADSRANPQVLRGPLLTTGDRDLAAAPKLARQLRGPWSYLRAMARARTGALLQLLSRTVKPSGSPHSRGALTPGTGHGGARSQMQMAPPGMTCPTLRMPRAASPLVRRWRPGQPERARTPTSRYPSVAVPDRCPGLSVGALACAALLVFYLFAASLRCQASSVAGVTGKTSAQCLRSTSRTRTANQARSACSYRTRPTCRRRTAFSSTSTSGPHKCPDQDRWPSSGTSQVIRRRCQASSVTRRDQPAAPQRSGQQPGQRGQDRTVGPVRPGPAHLAAQHHHWPCGTGRHGMDRLLDVVQLMW
jgi:hypothetical protein